MLQFLKDVVQEELQNHTATRDPTADSSIDRADSAAAFTALLKEELVVLSREGRTCLEGITSSTAAGKVKQGEIRRQGKDGLDAVNGNFSSGPIAKDAGGADFRGGAGAGQGMKLCCHRLQARMLPYMCEDCKLTGGKKGASR